MSFTILESNSGYYICDTDRYPYMYLTHGSIPKLNRGFCTFKDLKRFYWKHRKDAVRALNRYYYITGMSKFTKTKMSDVKPGQQFKILAFATSGKFTMLDSGPMSSDNVFYNIDFPNYVYERDNALYCCHENFEVEIVS